MSITPRGRKNGYVKYVPNDSNVSQRDLNESMILFALAGKAAEAIHSGKAN